MKKMNVGILMLLFLFLSKGIYSQNLGEKSTTTSSENLTPTSEPTAEYYKKYHSRLPSPLFLENLKAMAGENQERAEAANTRLAAMELPKKMWFPGEFEEVQAILMTWPYFSKFKDGSDATPIFKNVGVSYDGSRIDSITSTLDTFTSASRLPDIFANLANSIQQNAVVWINIWAGSDSTILKHFMQKRGTPLTNYKFFVNPGNSFWYRDCGPVAFYYGDEDSIGFMDFEYYSGRVLDDEIPIEVGRAEGFRVFTNNIEYEGGNILVDGAGSLFTSDAVYSANQDQYGQYYLADPNNLNSIQQRRKSPLSKTQVNDSLRSYMALDRVIVLPTFQNDGGTGHIDLYADMYDENNFVFSQFPNEMKNFKDYLTAQKNIDSICSLQSMLAIPYRKSFIPFPKKDNGTWYTSDNDYAKYTRTYSNHTFVNQAILQPIFSDTIWGPKSWDDSSLAIINKAYPGYTVYPIDIRGEKPSTLNAPTGFDGMGGAIHCITKQIPAENPIRILHGEFNNIESNGTAFFNLEATITNRSGISTASCFWRKKGETNWSSLDMSTEENNLFWTNIPKSQIQETDTIEYYLSATSYNGKTITKPLTAPKGYYEIPGNGEKRTSIAKIPTEKTIAVGEFFPNPANEKSTIEIYTKKRTVVQLSIYTIEGRPIYNQQIKHEEGSFSLEINTKSFPAGCYFVVFADENGNKLTKKLILSRP